MLNNSSNLQLHKDYYFQIYHDGKEGNIHKADGTVLVRIFLDETNFRFSFKKKNVPYEFGYDSYFVAMDRELLDILSIPHKDAEELYEVLCGFIN